MSNADEILMKKFEDKIEKYKKDELESIEYKTNYQFVSNSRLKFNLRSKRIEINGDIDLETLQAINEKVKELRMGG